MDNLEREYQDLVFERDRYRDAKAEELLGDEPELLKLYYLQRQHYQMAQKLQERLMLLTGTDNPLFRLAIQVSSNQDLADRAGRIDDLADVATDVVDLYDQVIVHLQSLVAKVRQQVTELPPPASEEMGKRLEEASSIAFQAANQRYGSQLSELQRQLVSRSKNTDADSEL
ncbi:hypothetical protein NDI45_24965 [Leptolyngbya sp. GB1-A1]|uniref:hypothetical protein n=1 Tax=Leptolyngbya sp. GB1-A1 TaxID=2933908 RepID=UPI00329910DC